MAYVSEAARKHASHRNAFLAATALSIGGAFGCFTTIDYPNNSSKTTAATPSSENQYVTEQAKAAAADKSMENTMKGLGGVLSLALTAFFTIGAGLNSHEAKTKEAMKREQLKPVVPCGTLVEVKREPLLLPHLPPETLPVNLQSAELVQVEDAYQGKLEARI